MTRSALPLLTIFLAASSFGQSDEFLSASFDAAASEFGVPADLLKAISYAETRWYHLTWSDGDTASCMGMPRPHGIMALWDNEVFGHSLDSAASILGLDKEVLRVDVAQNIRGAAALLRRDFDRERVKRAEPPDLTDPAAWSRAIELHSGIPQVELAGAHAYQVLFRMTKGARTERMSFPPREVNLSGVRARLQKLESERHGDETRTTEPGSPPDYPSARWVPGKADYFYTTGYGKKLVVIHDMEGYYASVLSYFQTLSDGRSVSIHYCVNGLQDSPSDYPPGDVAQMVEEQFYAWHAVCLNRYSLGIEHEGFALNPAWFTPEMYVESAKLVKYMCEKYGIPMDRNHIVGHNSWQTPSWVSWASSNLSPAQAWGTCNSHTDPGPFWDWDFFLQLIRRDSTAPAVASTPPSAPIQVDNRVSVTFSQRMEPVSTRGAVHITPSVGLNLSWADNGRTLRMQPTSLLPFDTEYTVTIDSSALNYIGIGLELNGDSSHGDTYSFTFRTVVQDAIPPGVTTTYPTEGQTQISTSAEFIANFDERLDQTTLSGGFALQTSTGIPFTVTGIAYSAGTNTSRVRFKTTSDLFPNTDYVLTVQQTIRDLSGNPLASTRSVNFRTEAPTVVSGTVINSLDAIGTWWQPSTSGSTRNVLATFAISTSTKRSGTGSGKVEYSFTQSSGGIIREHNTATPSIEGGPMVGAWVFGDKSGHELRFAFYYTSTSGVNSFATVSAGLIDWTGWKFRTVPVASVPVGNGSARRFASFMIYQTAGGEMAGTIYFDDLMLVSSVSDVQRLAENGVPDDYRLHQNFPNPFNPTTTITFDVPETGEVELSVWNVLGQRVETIVSGVRTAGRHVETFDGSRLTSGVYFVRLEAGMIRKQMRMVFAK